MMTDVGGVIRFDERWSGSRSMIAIETVGVSLDTIGVRRHDVE